MKTAHSYFKKTLPSSFYFVSHTTSIVLVLPIFEPILANRCNHKRYNS